MLRYEEIQKRLEGENKLEIAKGVGVSYPTVLKVLNTINKKVQYGIIERFSDYVEMLDKNHSDEDENIN